MCDCIRITYQETGQASPTTIQIQASGTYNGANYYEWVGAHTGNTYILQWFGGVNLAWIVCQGFGFPANPVEVETKVPATINCPLIGESPALWTVGANFSFFKTEACIIIPDVGPCQCGIDITISNQSQGIPAQTIKATVDGLYNNRLQFTFVVGGVRYYIRWNTGGFWEIVNPKPFPIVTIGTLSFDILCPEGTFDEWVSPTGSGWEMSTDIADCTDCGVEDRTKETYPSVKLPEPFVEEDRGDQSCCCKYMVLASATKDSWKNDITSVWIKKGLDSDTIQFRLYKEDQAIPYTWTYQTLPNDPLTVYSTLYWIDIIATYGEGCYEIRVAYDIAGISGDYVYAAYDLKTYTVENALNTARIRVKFNGYQETSGIDFTDSNVEDTFRFYGYIGNRQPNTELDNIIYPNREMKRVLRENLNSYEIITDPSLNCIIKPLLDLYLLSENELYISDYNSHNHSYRYLDLPVIVSDSPQVEYYEWSRKAKLTCEVTDKFKTNRTYYK